MPRARKPKTATVVEGTQRTDLEFADEIPSQPPIVGTFAQPVVTEEAAPTDTESASLPRGQFRSWVVDSEHGYTRLTDELNRRIILQFAEKPAPDVLTALKGAEFQFRPDYYGQKNCWVRRNDFQTRLQVEAIEKLLEVSAAPVLER